MRYKPPSINLLANYVVFSWSDHDDLDCVYASSYAAKKQRPNKLHLTDGKSSISYFRDRRLSPVARFAPAPAPATEWRKEATNKYISPGIRQEHWSRASKLLLQSQAQAQLHAAAAQKPNQVSGSQWWWRPVSSSTQHTGSRLAPPCHSWMNVYTFGNNFFHDCTWALLRKEIFEQFSSQTEMKRSNINDLWRTFKAGQTKVQSGQTKVTRDRNNRRTNLTNSD